MPTLPCIVECDVTAYATLRATAEELLALRQKAAPSLDRPLPAGLLKHGDEQTVAALAVTWRAIDHFGMNETPFAAWGILAGPRYLGRTAMAAAIDRFALEGAWGISPHLIPHRSLHSISGTLSQALQSHGANLGIGGGTEAVSELFLAAAALLEGDQLPGVWAVLTGWEPEPLPGTPPAVPPICSAAALALTPARANFNGLRFRWLNDGANVAAPPLSLETLCEALSAATPPVAAAWRLDGGLRLELQRVGAGARTLPERRAG